MWALAQGHGTTPRVHAPSDQLQGKEVKEEAGSWGGSCLGPLAGGAIGAQPLGDEVLLSPWGSLFLPTLSSCALFKNPLNKKPPKHQYCLYFEGFHRL